MRCGNAANAKEECHDKNYFLYRICSDRIELVYACNECCSQGSAAHIVPDASYLCRLQCGRYGERQWIDDASRGTHANSAQRAPRRRQRRHRVISRHESALGQRHHLRPGHIKLPNDQQCAGGRRFDRTEDLRVGRFFATSDAANLTSLFHL